MNKRCWYLLAVLLAASSVACRRDMQTQPKYTPLSRSWFYPDGRSARPIPGGTVSIDEVNAGTAVHTGSVNGQFVSTIPIAVTLDLLTRGEDRFNIYCSPCHGRTGNGKGMIASRGLECPADLNAKRVRNAPPGYLYQVIANGFGAMASYGYQIKSDRDRWAIVAYIRALELSRQATLDDVPANELAQLEAQK